MPYMRTEKPEFSPVHVVMHVRFQNNGKKQKRQHPRRNRSEIQKESAHNYNMGRSHESMYFLSKFAGFSGRTSLNLDDTVLDVLQKIGKLEAVGIRASALLVFLPQLRVLFGVVNVLFIEIAAARFARRIQLGDLAHQLVVIGQIRERFQLESLEEIVRRSIQNGLAGHVLPAGRQQSYRG